MLQEAKASDLVILLEEPLLYQWLQFRCDTITAYVRELSEAIHAIRPDIDFRWNVTVRDSERSGLNITAVAPYIDSFRLQDYAEQYGEMEAVKNKKLWLANARRQLGWDKPIIGGIAPRAEATPELIYEGVRVNAKMGVQGLSYGFYDGASYDNLRAIRKGMEMAGVSLKPFHK